MARYRSRSVFGQPQARSGPGWFTVIFFLLVIGAAAGAIYLGFWDYGPAVTTVEREIPNERFLPGN